MPLVEEHLVQTASEEEHDLITDETGFIDSTKSVLESHLGAHWRLALFVILLIVFWPSIVFWKYVKFDPPLFVTEWLKLATEGIILFLILEVLRHRSISFAAQRSSHHILLNTYVTSVQKIISELHECHEYHSKNDIKNASQAAQLAWRTWKSLENSLSNESIRSLPDAQARAGITQCRLDLKTTRCDSLMKSLRAAKRVEEFNYDELNELLFKFNSFMAALYGIYGDDKREEMTK